MGKNLFLGLVPDGTSIEQQQIRLSRVVSGQEPVPGSERIQHPAGVVLVHLAAKRLDVDQTPIILTDYHLPRGEPRYLIKPMLSSFTRIRWATMSGVMPWVSMRSSGFSGIS